jgi:hypothetical protein
MAKGERRRFFQNSLTNRTSRKRLMWFDLEKVPLEIVANVLGETAIRAANG